MVACLSWVTFNWCLRWQIIRLCAMMVCTKRQLRALQSSRFQALSQRRRLRRSRSSRNGGLTIARRTHQIAAEGHRIAKFLAEARTRMVMRSAQVPICAKVPMLIQCALLKQNARIATMEPNAMLTGGLKKVAANV